MGASDGRNGNFLGGGEVAQTCQMDWDEEKAKGDHVTLGIGGVIRTFIRDLRSLRKDQG